MKKHYDLLILGATALGAGIVEAHPELSIVILERTCSVAGEFCNSYKGGSAESVSLMRPESLDLKKEIFSRQAMDERGEWFPAISPILANRLNNSGADCCFLAVLKDIDECDTGFAVTFSAFGIDHSFTVSKIIDTTSKFTSRAFFGENTPAMREITFNYFDAEKKVHRHPSNDDIVTARAELYAQKTDIFKEAWELSYSPCEARRDIGAAAWIPSSARENFLTAYDDGAAAFLPGGTAHTVRTQVVYEGEYDLIIVGLGVAGSIAAVTAKEEGLHVLGIENMSAGGGTATEGLVLTYYYGYRGGVYRKLDARARERSDRFGPTLTWAIGADPKITEIDSSLSGCDIRYNAAFVDVIREGNRVTGIAWMEDGIRREASAKFVLDCSADSAVCVNAGCEMQGGREIDGGFQPYSSMQLTEKEGVLAGAYCDNGRMNHYDPDAFGPGILNATASHLHLREDYSPRTFFGIAPLIGLREGLRIIGEEDVEFEPLISGNRAKLPVYYGWTNLDNHGQDNALESRIYQDWNTVCGMWGYTISIPIPMGALIPRGYDGLLAAGRNVAIDHDVAMGLRMKDDVSKSGEAAARLAALAIKNGVPAREVDVETLRAKLFASECIKPEDEIDRIEKQRYDEFHESPVWCDDDAAIAAGLATDAPEYFMWSAKTNAKADVLRSLLGSESENARTNAALALALLGEYTQDSVRILCESALKRDGYTADAGRKYIMPRSVASINALGRVGAAEALPTLYTLMEDDRFIGDLPFKRSEFLADAGDYYFQYRSNIITALRDIASTHPEKRDEIAEKLHSYIQGKRMEVSLMWSPKKIDFTHIFEKIIDEI